MRLTGWQITVIFCVTLIVFGTLVFTGHAPASVLSTPLAAFFGWLAKSPIDFAPDGAIGATP